MPHMMLYVRYLMIFMYSGFGLYLVFSKDMAVFMQDWQRVLFGIVAVAYGLYRWAMLRKQERDE